MLDLPHDERARWCAEISQINERMNSAGETDRRGRPSTGTELADLANESPGPSDLANESLGPDPTGGSPGPGDLSGGSPSPDEVGRPSEQADSDGDSAVSTDRSGEDSDGGPGGRDG